jgi:hypothetical protein
MVEDRSIKHLCPVAEADNFSLLTVVYSGGHDGDECTPFAAVYRDEDARLIAAAPELLELIRLSIGNVRSLGPAGALAQVHTPYQEWLAQLEAVYTKATGEAA